MSLKKGTVSVFAGMLVCMTAPAAPRPNIVLILVDDMGWSDIGCYGGEIETPNLDSLAANGIRFSQFYNTAKCFTTRASLLTGAYQHQVGYADDYTSPLRNCVTLGEVLRSAGYHTYASGKHHSRDNLFDRGFDHYYGLFEGACNHFNPGLQREGEPEPARKEFTRYWADDALTFNTRNPDYQDYFPEDFYSTDSFTAKAQEYLAAWQAQDTGHPFFLYLAYTAPHDPLMAWPEDIAKYDGVYDAGYEEIRTNRYSKQISMGLINQTQYELSPPSVSGVSLEWGSLSSAEKADQTRRMQVYAAMIDRVDQKIGELVDQLKSMGVYDNTLILFCSDNGCAAGDNNFGDLTAEIGGLERYASLQKRWANVSNTPFRYFKVDAEEGGIRTPMIAHWPDGIVSPGRITNKRGHLIDFMPTLLELTGADYPREYNGQAVVPLQGESLADVLYNQPVATRPTLYFEYSSGRAVIDADYKLVSNNSGFSWRLYNMANDSTELNDLSAAEPTLKSALLAKFTDWFNAVHPNRMPHAVNDVEYGVPASNTLIDVLANDTDPDGSVTIDTSTLVVTREPFFGTVCVMNRKVLYTPATTAVTACDRFGYRVQDNKGQWSNEGLVTVDFANGESAQSSIRIEAETTTDFTAAIQMNQPSASGSFINFNPADPAEYVEWQFDSASATAGGIVFTYALGADLRQLHLTINGEFVSALTFQSTGDWDVWGGLDVSGLSFQPGSNTVRVATLTNEDGPNLDYLNILLAGPDSDSDSDLDGMTDRFENQFPVFDKNDPHDAGQDLDGDGVSNIDEYNAKTDLNSASSRPAAALLAESDTEMRIEWSAMPGQPFRISESTNLNNSWSPVTENVPESDRGKVWISWDAPVKFIKVEPE